MGSSGLFIANPILYQPRETTILAHRVRVVAEIPDDLHEPLLRERAAENASPRTPQQTLARQAQHGVVFGWRPGEVATLDFPLQFLVPALARPRP